MKKIAILLVILLGLGVTSAGAFDDGIWYCSDPTHPLCDEIVFDVP